MFQANADIKDSAKNAGVLLWQIADYYGCSESTLYRKLRHELPAAEKEKIMEIIERIKGGA